MRALLILLPMLFSLTLSSQLVEPGILLYDPDNRNTIDDAAVNFYTKQLQINPDDVRALILRSELYRATNREDLANRDLMSAMDRNPYAKIYLHSDHRKDLFPIKKFAY